MAQGHHFVPEAVRKAIQAMLSSDANRVFEQAVTGNPYRRGHGWDEPHVDYNKRVLTLAKNYISTLEKQGKLKKGKMSGQQAEFFVTQIKKNGFGDGEVYKFNRWVLKQLRLLALGGIAAAGVNEILKVRKFDQSQKLKFYYRTAKEALDQGDWKTADKAIRGGGGFGRGGNNLINELTELGYVHEAGILDGRWKNRVLQFRDVEAGHDVPGVPNNFDAYVGK